MSRRRPRPVDRRMLAGVAVVVLAGAIALGADLRALLVAVMALVIVATAWLAFGLGSSASPVEWSRWHDAAFRPHHPDGRVRLLRAKLVSETAHRSRRQRATTDRRDATDGIADGLIRLIDDHLLHECGIDRATEPAAAADVLGPDLTRFVDEQTKGRSIPRRQELAATVTLIEDLVFAPDTQPKEHL